MVRRIEVNQVECETCEHIYNSNEDDICPQCKDTKEIYEELFGPDNMDNKSGYP